jgi:hypothetical protein
MDRERERDRATQRARVGESGGSERGGDVYQQELHGPGSLDVWAELIAG